ncbi:IclR family transcriptional regulator [Xenophilus arseniciresistens]|uniref:IclR family transcriptional regulator n=1 Tax=Xenophilus arseniciresistens TaxID=1283306 RepID=A0AAE3SYG0_9BURK|nr:IclR family transcriptional regulator [Xenophilus arseniciresistens]MDA7416057.1 IclR family transcriptional regulator [Xenophilus arseniciresistens]
MNNTLVKGLAIVELLAHSERALGLTEIAAELALAKSNVHRLLQALTEARYIVRDERSGRYVASIKLWELGSAVLSKLDLRVHAEQVMDELLLGTRETVHLSVLDGDEVVYVHKLDSPNPVRAYTQIGGRAKAHCVATGKAMLAFHSPAMLERLSQNLQAHTPRSIVDPARFLQEMARIRVQGFAHNRGEWNESVCGVASPVVDASGHVVAALGLSGPKDRFKPAQVKAFAPLVVEAAARISRRLGAREALPVWR